MDFDIVIATRNRQHALRLSIPLMLSQGRLPGRVILVDSSDDHDATRRTVLSAAEQCSSSVSLVILHSSPGLCKQRNLSLRHVRAPIVFFPDDDALWFPGFSHAVMTIYERDKEGLVGGVGGTESLSPPPGVLPGTRAPTDGLTIRIPGLLERTLNAFEKRFFMDPFFLEARALYRDKKIPPWLGEEEALAASTITGFRMSFRTELIQRIGFDEVLGRYGLFEDHDASTAILRSHCLVNAGRAKVFHYRPPEKRADELELGMMHILNRAYILCKHAPPDFPALHVLVRYTYYKLVRYLLRAYTRSARRRLLGAWRAAQCLPKLCSTAKPDLPDRYLALREACLKSG